MDLQKGHDLCHTLHHEHTHTHPLLLPHPVATDRPDCAFRWREWSKKRKKARKLPHQTDK